MRASWNSVKGETYSIMIQGFGFRTTFVGVIPLKLYGNYGITIGSFVAPMNDQCNDTQIPEALNEPFEGTLVGATSFKSDTNVSGSCIDDAVQALVFFSSVPPEFVSTAWHTVTGTGSILVAELNKPDFALFVVINVFEGTCDSLGCADTLEFSSWASREGALSQWKSIPGRNYFVVVTAATVNNNWQDEYTVTIREENSDPPVCFPGESIVDVRNKGLVRLDILQIGDYVRVGTGDIFDRVYSFGHKHESAIADYLCIHVRGIDTPLIISRAHLVFIAEGLAVPTSSLTVHDNVLTQSGELGVIIKIEKVTRRGIYAPFTVAGSIVVNSIVASSYVSFQEKESGMLSHKLMIGGMETPLTMQWAAHVALGPHRLLCRLSWDYFCAKDTYFTNSGLTWWSDGGLRFAQWLNHRGELVMFIVGAPLLLILSMFFALETVLRNVDLHHLVGLFGICYYAFSRHRKALF